MINTTIPDIISIFDLMVGAASNFTEVVFKIEGEQDHVKRAEIALNYIKEQNYRESISYEELDEAFHKPQETSIDFWRNIYLIERSIPPRSRIEYSFYQRAVLFHNTYFHEKNIVENGIAPNNSKFYFELGSDNALTHHDTFAVGRGEFLADFYYLDNDKKITVEHKFCAFNSLKDCINYYKNKCYNSKFLTIYKPNDGYYFVDLVNNTNYKLDNLITPKELI